jgi:hypothetical protein
MLRHSSHRRAALTVLATNKMAIRPPLLFLLLLVGLLFFLSRIVDAATDFSIEWIDNTIAVLDERTVVLHFEYRVGNIQECQSGETTSCLFQPTVRTELGATATCSADVLTIDGAITLRPVEIKTESVNVYVEVDVIAAANAQVPGLIVDNVLSLCVQLNSYAADGDLLINSFEVVQRATITLTGTFVLERPITTEALDPIRDAGGSEGDAFQIPISVTECSEQPTPVDPTAPILDLCVAANNTEFSAVSTLLEAIVERPQTRREQPVIEKGTIVDATDTELDCGTGLCRVRFQLDLDRLGPERGTLRFFGVAVVAIGGLGGGRRRQLDSTEQQQQEHSFVYEFELPTLEETKTRASSFASSPLHDWCKHIIMLWAATLALLLCRG